MKTKNRILSSILSLCLMCGMAVPAFAANVSTAGGTGTTPVELTAAATTFSVTVPTSIAITVNADASVTCPSASAVKITNNSAGTVKVSNIAMNNGAWTLASYNGGSRALLAAENVDANALEENPDQNFLGELFMRLGLSNEHNGQFFTPYHMCHFMAEICYGGDMKKKIEDTGWVTVNEPTCGSGAMLVAFANVCRQKGLNYQTDVLFVAQDIDPVVACMCYLQMSLLGCPGYVVVGDALTRPLTSIDRRGLIPMPDPHIWYTPCYFRKEWQYRCEAFCVATLVGELLNLPQTAPQAQAGGEQEAKPESEPVTLAVDWSVMENGQLTFL